MIARVRFALALVALTALGWGAAPSAQAQQTTSIKVGMIPIEPAALVYYAKDMGFFDRVGLNVTIEPNPSTPALASAIASGTLDISYATIPTLAVAHTKNLPFVAIAPGIEGGASVFGGAIMVAANSPIKTGKDFNGKTLAAAGLNTIAEYLPRAWIDKHGGDSTTVKFIEMPFPQEADAIATGRVDGAYLVEPFASLAERRKIVKMVATGDDAIGPNYIATAWFTTAQWAKAHPDVVARFTSAMHDAALWANANGDKAVAIFTKELKADAETTSQARRPRYAEKLDAGLLQPYIDVTAKYAKFTPFPASELLYVPGR